MREISMVQIFAGHEHIVHYIGFVNLETGPVMTMEYCSNGDLLSFLREALKSAKTEVFSVVQLKYFDADVR